jgi:hypothetical protein
VEFVAQVGSKTVGLSTFEYKSIRDQHRNDLGSLPGDDQHTDVEDCDDYHDSSPENTSGDFKHDDESDLDDP